MVVPSLSSSVFPEVLSGLTQELIESLLKPVIGVTDYDLKEKDFIREMPSWRTSGLVAAGLERTYTTRIVIGG